MVQLDHMSGGRAIFGSGPGALSSDAYALGIDPMVQRDRQDEAIGIIKRLMAGERVTRREQLVHAARCGAADPAAAGGDAVRHRLADFALRHDARRQARHRRDLDRLAVDRRPDRAADAVGICRRCREEARQDRQPQGLARAAELAHRRDAREGARGSRQGPDALAQRIHRRHAAAAGRETVQVDRRRARADVVRHRDRPPPSARRTIW